MEEEQDLYTIRWEAEKIVMKKSFDTSLDLFSLAMFSHHTFVSKRFKNAIFDNGITGPHTISLTETLEGNQQEPFIEFQ